MEPTNEDGHRLPFRLAVIVCAYLQSKVMFEMYVVHQPVDNSKICFVIYY